MFNAFFFCLLFFTESFLLSYPFFFMFLNRASRLGGYA